MKSKRFTFILVMLLISSFFIQGIPTSVLADDITDSEEYGTVASEGIEEGAEPSEDGGSTIQLEEPKLNLSEEIEDENEGDELPFLAEEGITPNEKWNLIPTNPDNLSVPDDSPGGGAIDYGVYPATNFPSEVTTRSLMCMKPNDPTKPNDPNKPGEVVLSKVAEPVDGMVNTWDVTLRIEGKNEPTTSDIILVIDTSGSMGLGTGKMGAAIASAHAFIDTLLPSDTTRIGIVSFANEAIVQSQLTNNKLSLHATVNSLWANGGTFTQAGVKQAQAMLANSDADLKNIVLLSDGLPTYSYGISNTYLTNANYLEAYGSNYQTSTNMPAAAYLTTRVGAGNSLQVDSDAIIGSGWNSKHVYYNHGNSAIAQAGFAKSAGNRLWTIALSVDYQGLQILNGMASPNSAYTALPSDLINVFTNIAGQIGSAVNDAVVSDPMGVGFEIPVEEVSNITTSQGIATYDNKKIDWNPGTLTKPIETGSDIMYAEMTYRIEINDEILDVMPDENGKYPTNGDTKVFYTDANGNAQTKEFPVPMVNPVFYKVVKVLQDKDGNEITADRDFTINITGPYKDGTDTVREIVLNTSSTSSTKLMTDLRYRSTYEIEEIGNLDDYEVTYLVNGEPATSFDIKDNDTEDVTVEVINKEKPVNLPVTNLTVHKIWQEENINHPEKIKVNLLKDGIVEDSIELSKDNDWSFIWEDLDVDYKWTVEEVVPEGYVASYEVKDNVITIINALKEPEKTEPTKTEPTEPEPTKPEPTKTTKPTPTTKKVKKPVTGENVMSMILFAGILLALGIVILIIRVRKSNVNKQ